MECTTVGDSKLYHNITSLARGKTVIKQTEGGSYVREPKLATSELSKSCQNLVSNIARGGSSLQTKASRKQNKE